jgi:aryl-alcohol dehydrogenase-like predicted oxidoreductase
MVGEIATRAGRSPAQIVFAFARAMGMLPLTGTSSAQHMEQDLVSSQIALSPEAVLAIESIAG